MTWTQTPPTEPDWYWWRPRKDAPFSPVLFNGEQFQFGGQGPWFKMRGGQWSDTPIPLPREPESR